MRSVLLALSIVAISAAAEARSVRVIDGNTFVASDLRAPVRIKGIDVPQIYKYKCDAELALGLKARDALVSMLRPSHHKIVVKRTQDFDGSGRRIAIVTSDDEDVSQMLIDQGFAKPWSGSGKRPDWCSQ